MATKAPRSIHLSDSDEDQVAAGNSGDQGELSSPTPAARSAGKQKRQRRPDDSEEDEDKDEAGYSTPSFKPSSGHQGSAMSLTDDDVEFEDNDRTPTKIPKTTASARRESNVPIEDEYERDVPESLRKRISHDDWRFHRQQQQSVDLTSRMIDICREQAEELKMKPSNVQNAPRKLSDLSAFSNVIGERFGDFIDESFTVTRALWLDGTNLVNDPKMFGKTMGKLLEAFINGKAPDFRKVTRLASVSLDGINEVTPDSDITFDVASPPRKGTATQTLKRKLEVLESASPLTAELARLRTTSVPSPPSSASKNSKVYNMTEDELRERMEYYQTEAATYDLHGNMSCIGTGQRPAIQAASKRWITVPELIKVLLAEPWKVIATRAFAFRMLDTTYSDASVQAIWYDIKRSIEDGQHLIARWERQFRIQIPTSEEDLLLAYPNETDRTWIRKYRDDRGYRGNQLLSLCKTIETNLKKLIGSKKLPASTVMDPGLMTRCGNVIAWMPTTERLLYDMAQRAARDPSRFNSIFNPATHVFYRENLQHAFPVNPDAPHYIPIATTDPSLFTDKILGKYPIDILRQEAKAEWEFYQHQLEVPLREPEYPAVKFPYRKSYAKEPASRYARTRYAYYHKGHLLKNPVDRNGNTIQVEKWDHRSEWIQQPITTHTITMYDRGDPGANVWPPRNE